MGDQRVNPQMKFWRLVLLGIVVVLLALVAVTLVLTFAYANHT